MLGPSSNTGELFPENTGKSGWVKGDLLQLFEDPAGFSGNPFRSLTLPLMPLPLESNTEMLHIRNIRKRQKYEKQNRKIQK